MICIILANPVRGVGMDLHLKGFGRVFTGLLARDLQQDTPKDHIKRRILQHTVSGIPLVLGPGTECGILVFMRSFGPPYRLYQSQSFQQSFIAECFATPANYPLTYLEYQQTEEAASPPNGGTLGMEVGTKPM